MISVIEFLLFLPKIKMMNLENRIRTFARLGELLRRTFGEGEKLPATEKLRSTAENLTQYNGWFTPEFVFRALSELGKALREDKLRKWTADYASALATVATPKMVGVVMAGNVPAVGFHDFLCVLMSGHRLQARLSSDDDKLMPAIADVLLDIEPAFDDFITFTDKNLKEFDAIIATGSNNTSRYFEYYFGKYPHIIRKNRNGLAVLTGDETPEDLEALADDVFLYYGLGCRNVAKLFVPRGYDFDPLLEVLGSRKEVIRNHKYFNNYEYNKAVFLVNRRSHLDTGNLLLTEDAGFASPVGVLYYDFYSSPTALRNLLTVHGEQIQCVVSKAGFPENRIEPGKSQSPELWDYADGVDTMAFLLSL
jgi:hypothetical protein